MSQLSSAPVSTGTHTLPLGCKIAAYSGTKHHQCYMLPKNKTCTKPILHTQLQVRQSVQLSSVSSTTGYDYIATTTCWCSNKAIVSNCLTLNALMLIPHTQTRARSHILKPLHNVFSLPTCILISCLKNDYSEHVRSTGP